MVQQQEGVHDNVLFLYISYGFIIPDANPDISSDGIIQLLYIMNSLCPSNLY